MSGPTRECEGYPYPYLKNEPKNEINFYLPNDDGDGGGDGNNKNHFLACSWITSPSKSPAPKIKGSILTIAKKKDTAETRDTKLLNSIHPSLIEIDTSRNVIIICHGMFSWRNQMLIANLANELTEKLDCHSFRFDFSGNGHSSGTWSLDTYQSDYEDLCTVYKFLKETMKCNVQCIIGHSRGSAAILKHAAAMSESDGEGGDQIPLYVNLSGRCYMQTVAQIESKFSDYERRELHTKGKFLLPKRGNRVSEITSDSIENCSRHDISKVLESIKNTNVLTIHGTRDNTNSFENAKRFDELIQNHTLKVIENGDHNFNGLLHMKEIVLSISAFIQAKE